MAGLTMISELVALNYSNFPQKKKTIGRHLHHFYQLDIILSGSVTITVEGAKPRRGKAGDGWLIPPLINHQYDSFTSYSHSSFKFQLAPQYWDLFGKEFQYRRMPDDLVIAATAAGEHYQKHSPVALPQAVAAATLCLLHFFNPKKKITAVQAPHLDLFRYSLLPLLAQIASAPNEDWSLSRMAQACHLSNDYFSKCFHQIVRMTPQRYIIETRIRAAALELTGEPTRPIKDIAQKSRYTTIHAFSRAFTQIMGMAPAAYRQANREH